MVNIAVEKEFVLTTLACAILPPTVQRSLVLPAMLQFLLLQKLAKRSTQLVDVKPALTLLLLTDCLAIGVHKGTILRNLLPENVSLPMTPLVQSALRIVFLLQFSFLHLAQTIAVETENAQTKQQQTEKAET